MVSPGVTEAPQETVTPATRPPTTELPVVKPIESPEEAIRRFYSLVNEGRWDDARAMTLDLNLDGVGEWNAGDDFYIKETRGGELQIEGLTIRDVSNPPFTPSSVGASEGYRVDLTFVIGEEEFYSVEYWVKIDGGWKVIV